MIRDTVAKRYAQAAFEIARGRDSLEEWATDLALVAQGCEPGEQCSEHRGRAGVLAGGGAAAGG